MGKENVICFCVGQFGLKIAVIFLCSIVDINFMSIGVLEIIEIDNGLGGFCFS